MVGWHAELLAYPPGREALLKGKAQYTQPPCTNRFGSATFDNANIIVYFNTKQASLKRSSIVLSLYVKLVFPTPGNFTQPACPLNDGTYWHLSHPITLYDRK
jgi:hypothetical protein